MKRGRNGLLSYFAGNLSEVFKIRKRILGKVDLQKTVYFMTRLGAQIPFDFRWNILGPHSYDLAHHSDHLVVEGLFKYTGKYLLNEEMAKSHDTNLEPETRERIESFFLKLEEICSTKGYDPVFFIECTASLDFIQLNLPKKENRKKVTFNLLDALKPEKTALFRTFREDAWTFLSNEGLIQ